MAESNIVLEPQTARLLKAAQGWMELGNLMEAMRELDDVPQEVHLHPAVLMMRCEILVAGQQWGRRRKSPKP
jgi:hypothetical protein